MTDIFNPTKSTQQLHFVVLSLDPEFLYSHYMDMVESYNPYNRIEVIEVGHPI